MPDKLTAAERAKRLVPDEVYGLYPLMRAHVAQSIIAAEQAATLAERERIARDLNEMAVFCHDEPAGQVYLDAVKIASTPPEPKEQPNATE